MRENIFKKMEANSLKKMKEIQKNDPGIRNKFSYIFVTRAFFFSNPAVSAVPSGLNKFFMLSNEKFYQIFLKKKKFNSNY